MAGSVQVITEIEKPDGRVLVEAIASKERDGDARPIAGFFVRRRYHGDRFRIASPQEFSATWMRFVEEPPKDWQDKIKKFTKVDDIADLMYQPPVDPNKPFSMSELQERDRHSMTMNYSNGKVVPRRNA
jgi:hypothetical protein